MIYTGIGSRETPTVVLNLIHMIGQVMAKRGHILRSGHANGADLAFELGCIAANGTKEIYLPWKGFNREAPYVGDGYMTPQLPVETYEIAAKFHPAWNRCSNGAKSLHARNVCQILGAKLDTITNGVICWTKDGKRGGGTGQALRIATAYNVPIWDLGLEKDTRNICEHLDIPHFYAR